MTTLNRRNFVKLLAAAPLASALTVPTSARAAAEKRVVVVGGGFGGATAAKYIRRMDPKIKVTLMEANKTYVSCPLSNEVISNPASRAGRWPRDRSQAWPKPCRRCRKPRAQGWRARGARFSPA